MGWRGLDPGDQALLGIDADHDDRLATVSLLDDRHAAGIRIVTPRSCSGLGRSRRGHNALGGLRDWPRATGGREGGRRSSTPQEGHRRSLAPGPVAPIRSRTPTPEVATRIAA